MPASLSKQANKTCMSQCWGAARLLGYLLPVLLTLGAYTPCQAQQWQLEKKGELYNITVRSKHGDKLILSHEGEDTRFVLITAARQEQPNNRRMLQYWFDTDTTITKVGFTRLDKHKYLIKLSSPQKTEIINRMIPALELHMRYLVDDGVFRDFTFSLIGFTAVLNDFLIAHEIGHLDPEWLNENHKNRELMCFYAANFSVLAMLDRKQGLTMAQSANKLKASQSNVLDEVISNIVKQVYSMPLANIPRDPRGDKFGIFQRCMQSGN